MLQSFLSRATLIFVSSTLAVLCVACSEDKLNTATGGDEQPMPIGDLAPVQPSVKPVRPAASPEAQPLDPFESEPSLFEMGRDKAVGAWSISQSAQSPDDWKLVASQYQDAIALMQKIRRQSPEFAIAQTKITEYRRQVKYAQQQANPRPVAVREPQKIVVVVPQRETTPKFTLPPRETKPLSPAPALPSSAVVIPDEAVFTAPIKRRIGGTPIVEVTFNGQQQFEMIVDTGASGTVITQEMANALGIVTVGKAKANTASSRAVEFPVGYVNSMAVGGVVVNRVAVAIAGAELETGLLGHDFFGNYDVTIKRNVVEFRPQLRSQINSPETQLTAPTSSKQPHFVGYP
ncbi:MAG: retropepsin-like aspartic protease [Nostoc sp. DedQUE08]|uniref:retropepsin-like aspartic protease family protein n=1 Tax=unclassified Nostoc TaxID=2593658 RepID=UPI002AD3178C|nr:MULTISPECIES: retropepsin-like aspartic protease [unclassified Nostoc]MDZ8067148.1 retropepsin-like aspartic protease [Nostoc sp. DedQUE08]MDZ8095282.1 retropepsin-like aspartic protease [Nostoc sp. DedQUE05]